MPVYLVTQVNVTDPQKFQEYGKLAGPISAKYGGRVIVRGAPKTVLEGDITYSRIAVTEFPDAEAARRYYDSPEYQEAKSKRVGAADFNMVIVEG
jgi:uncharacterized protein (DUF1330 family)